ncbi:L2 [Francolinus leucoscepus papillomavirus 1]|uniref:L2 n=1 Tax=Francolinus leucoscepus papillomavirus 1 TaxID=485362 RepID=C6ZDA4_9PAPI|nr:L2 [Francolinus leucoscepus papillomavirus 1]ABX61090.1 L2 [Francolinus leucoscepus papillomavirus 1]
MLYHYRISLPRPQLKRRRTHTHFNPYGLALFSYVPPASQLGLGRRRKRAAAEDIWRSCQMGGDCPPDVYNRFTHSTIADRILTWGSSGVFFGDLGIVPEAGARPPEGPHVPWPGLNAGRGNSTTGSFIPHERPFQLPNANVPVEVQPQPPVRIGPETSTTIVNPVFDGEVISVSSGDNVVLGEPVPVPPETAPGEAYTPASTEFPERDARGDTFTSDVTVTGGLPAGRVPFAPMRPTQPSSAGPFETVELGFINPGYIDEPSFQFGTTDFGGFEDTFEDTGDIGDRDDIPLVSTPEGAGRGPSRQARTRGAPRGNRVSTLYVDNPLYDATVDTIFDREAWEADEDFDSPLGSPEVFERGRSLVLGRLARLRGQLLRSGRRVPYVLRLLHDISPIQAPEGPNAIELRSLTPVGSADTVVISPSLQETSIGSTVPWDGSPLGDSSVISVGPDPDAAFYEVDLGEPFPEMEIIDDDQVVTPPPYPYSSGDIVSSAGYIGSVRHHTTARGPTGSTVGGLTPVQPQQVPIRPGLPGVLVGYNDFAKDPSLYWWFIRRRRARRFHPYSRSR